MKRHSILVRFSGLVLLSILSTACLDEIDLDTTDSDKVLVVEGFVQNGQGPQEVRIRMSGGFQDGVAGIELPVNDARVLIREIGGADYNLTLEHRNGLYVTRELFAKPGASYQLIIEYENNLYESSVEFLPAPIPIDSVSFSYESKLINDNSSNNLVEENFVNVFAHTRFPDDAAPSFLKYRIKGTYEFQEDSRLTFPEFCFVDDVIDFRNIVIVNSEDVHQGVLKDQLIIEKQVDYKFAFHYCFTVIQETITENGYLFWETIKNEYERTGDIFESAPGRVRGNVNRSQEGGMDVIGYFAAKAVDSTYLLVNSGEVGAPRQYCGFSRFIIDICSDCHTIARSRILDPPYLIPECFR